MSGRCVGSDQGPQEYRSPAVGRCPACGSWRVLRNDGLLPKHQARQNAADAADVVAGVLAEHFRAVPLTIGRYHYASAELPVIAKRIVEALQQSLGSGVSAGNSRLPVGARARSSK